MAVLRWAGRMWTGVLLVSVLLLLLLLGLRFVLPIFAAPPTLATAFPANGESAVSPRAVPVLAFASPMNPRSVERALQIDPTVAAVYRWNADFTTLTVSPTTVLRTDTQYVLTLAASAQSRLFRPLAAPVRLAFRVWAGPEVTATLPAHNARDVPPHAPIVLRFSRPIVPAALVATPQQAPLLEWSPPLSGTVTWLNPSAALFRPALPLQQGTHYTATLVAGLTDQSGALLQEPFTWSFSTAAPALLQATPTDGSQAVAPAAPLVLHLSQPFDPAVLRQSLAISPSVQLDASAALLPDATQVITLTPVGGWQPETSYQVALQPGARATVGDLGLEQATNWTFRTAPMPQVIGRFPGEGQTLPAEQDIRLIFTTPVADNALRAALRFSPPASNIRVAVQGTEARISADLRAATTYTITLDAGLRDQNNLALGQPYQLRFATPPAVPQLLIAGEHDHIVQLPSSTGGLVLTRTNLSALTTDVFQLDETTVVRVADFATDAWAQFSPERSGQRLVRSQRQTVADPLNTPTAAPLPLVDAAGAPLPDGAYYVRVRTPEGPQADLLLLLGHTRLLWQQGSTGALAWATDSANGTPLGNLPLAVYRQGALVQRGTTAADGVWPITAALGTEPYVLVAAGGTSVLRSTPQAALANPQPTHFQAFITTDRTTYRAGDHVQVAGFVRVAADPSLALPPAGTQAQLSARPLKETARFYETTVAVSNTGVLSAGFALPPTLAPGDHLITVRIGAESWSTPFTVAAPDAPLVVLLQAPAVAAAGDPLQAQVSVHTPEEVPVASATISWTLRAEPAAPLALTGYQVGDAALDAPSGTWRGTAQTNAAGQATITLPNPSTPNRAPARFVLDVAAREPAGPTSSAETTMLAAPAGVLAGVYLPSRVLAAGTQHTVELFSAALDGTPAANTPMRVEVFAPGSATTAPMLARSISTNNAGRAQLGITLPGGAYRLVATARDASGRTTSTATPLWVHAANFTGWNNPLQLVPDRTSYNPGDTATLLPTTPFSQAAALIAVQRGSQFSFQTRLLRAGDVITVPLALDEAGPVRVGVQLVEQAGSNAAARTASATFTLPFQPNDRALRVTLETDRASYAPAATATLTITTSAADGQPVPADVVLGVANAAAAPAADVAVAFGQQPAAAPPAQGTNNAAQPATLAWHAAVRTNATGVLTLSVPLDAALGDFTATAWAARRDGARPDAAGFGQAQRTIAITSPLQLALALPERLRVGDAVHVEATVRNTSPQTQTVALALSASGLRADAATPPQQTVTLAPGQAAPVRWPATVSDALAASVSVAARGTGGTVAATLPARPILLSDTATLEQATVLASDQYSQSIDLAPPPVARLVIEAAPSLAALAHQTLAEHNPNASTLDSADTLLIGAAFEATNPATTAALNRLLAAQQPDGAWPWWPATEPDAFATAHVLEALAAAQRAGLAVPAEPIRHGLAALALLADESTPTLHAYVQYVQALHGQADQAAIARLVAQPNDLDAEAAAYLLLAAPPNDANRDALRQRLLDTTQRAANGVFWQTSRDATLPSTPAAVTGLVVQALRQANADADLLRAAERWLLAQRGITGWDTGGAAARALLALQPSDDAPRAAATVTFNGVPILALDATAPVTATSQITLATSQIRAHNMLAVRGGLVYLSYRLQAPGEISAAAPDQASLLREYLDPQTGAPLDLNDIRSGQLVRVQLTVVANEALRYVMLQDVLPGGALPVALSADADGGYAALRDGQFFAASTALAPGVYEYSYLMRAAHAGTFSVPPAAVAAPNAVFATSAAAQMQIVTVP